ncbi:MAG: tRNA (adenosine(37)-N6)-threonylcarbamoyltransferase complex dimerization subunit type 1 TsaB [Anaerolineae bacterium]|nr:tRNA (adenosine(37)-N6)-threonylcarbamoyltransferase complex dimerization subunit type 1 TsaB [Anaerolineae bacterium]
MLLAIDTATNHASIALHDGSFLRGECTWESPNRHTVTLVPRINQMLQASELTPEDLSAIAICIGPGSYTGVRIGVSVAKGLASAQKVPLIGVSTLDILVAAYPQDARPLYALYAAGRKRAGYARYRWTDEGWKAETSISVADWEKLAGQIVLPAILLGEINVQGLEALRTLYGRIEIPPPAQHLRRAGFLADLAWVRLRANQVDDPAALVPVYTR